MKQYIISKAKGVEIGHGISDLSMPFRTHGNDDMQVSDGFHTMDELYDHRITLYVALCKQFANRDAALLKRHLSGQQEIIKLEVWRSKNHSDGTAAFGGTWFVLGIGKQAGTMITYHIPIERWEETDFAETLDQAPEYDGHTSADVLTRLKNL